MPGQNFLLPWLDIVEVVSAEKLSDTMCRATFKFPVQPEFLNPMGTLHAGATSAFFECATTWTLFPIGKPGFWKSLGICRTIGFTYLRPAVAGEVLLMECEVSADRLTDALTFLRCGMLIVCCARLTDCACWEKDLYDSGCDEEGEGWSCSCYL